MADDNQQPKGLLGSIGDPLGAGLGKVLSPVGVAVGAVTKPVTDAVGPVTKPALEPLAASVGSPLKSEQQKAELSDAGKPGGEKLGGQAQSGGNPLGL